MLAGECVPKLAEEGEPKHNDDARKSRYMLAKNLKTLAAPFGGEDFRKKERVCGQFQGTDHGNLWRQRVNHELTTHGEEHDGKIESQDDHPAARKGDRLALPPIELVRAVRGEHARDHPNKPRGAQSVHASACHKGGS